MLFSVAFLFMFFQYTVFAVLTIFGLYAALIGNMKKFYEMVKKAFFGDGGDDDYGGDDDDDL
jgi:hypothetical protein